MYRQYSNTAIPTSLVADVTSAATTVSVGATTGYPSVPFTIAVDRTVAGKAELMEVTAVAGTTFTVTRGVGGTTAVPHTAGAAVVHTNEARDFTLYTESLLHQIMTPGAPAPGIKKASGQNIGTAPGVNVQHSVPLFTVPAGRKYVVKSLYYVNVSASTTWRAGFSISGLAWGIMPNFTDRMGGLGVPPSQTVVVDTAVVVNAGETLNASTEHTNLYVGCTYIDLPAVAPVARIAASAGHAGTGYSTVYTATGPFCITSMHFASLGTSPVNFGVRVGTSNAGHVEHRLDPQGWLNVSSPMPMATSEVLQIGPGTSNALGYIVSGLHLPA